MYWMQGVYLLGMIVLSSLSIGFLLAFGGMFGVDVYSAIRAAQERRTTRRYKEELLAEHEEKYGTGPLKEDAE